jgi:hypothetical protein
MSDERRRFTRVPFQVKAELEVGERTLEADDITNLSMGGCLLPLSTEIEEGASCCLRIRLTGASSDLNVQVEGEVLRGAPGTVAVKFTRVDIDSLFHLRSIVLYNSDDPDAVEQEFRTRSGVV